jgi:tRNA (mo5U34)-methyltransferase
MRLYQRACLVVANEGLSGLARQTWRKFFPGQAPEASPTPLKPLQTPAPKDAEEIRQQQKRKAREDYDQLEREFPIRAAQLGCRGFEEYFWYHTVDLGNGLITPGGYDYRSCLDSFHFPADMHGLRVLDIGAATGFFSFEFEKRGAFVVAHELPSYDLDKFPGETEEQTRRKHVELLGYHMNLSNERRAQILAGQADAEMYRMFLDGPFHFCHQILGSKVQRCYSRIYDLSEENTGGGQFDLVYLGDVLLHTINPLQALAAVARLCRGTLVLSQTMDNSPDGVPAMHYVGGEEAGKDAISWWLPNRPCMEQMLRKLGFRTVEVVGANDGWVRPSCYFYTRTVLHARR